MIDRPPRSRSIELVPVDLAPDPRVGGNAVPSPSRILPMFEWFSAKSKAEAAPIPIYVSLLKIQTNATVNNLNTYDFAACSHHYHYATAPIHLPCYQFKRFFEHNELP